MYNHDPNSSAIPSDYVVFDDWTRGRAKNTIMRNGFRPLVIVYLAPDNPRKDVMNRLLNVCFLDHHMARPVELLYRLIYEALHEQGLMTPDVETELNSQYLLEFQWDPSTMSSRYAVNLETEWSGYGGLEKVVLDLEKQNPILRLWRREMPRDELGQTRSCWERFIGKGWDEVGEAEQYDGTYWGAGWDGKL
jgi:hypothetical protein